MTETATIEVRINGDDREIPRGLSVWGLLEWLDLNPALVVVEMNREILDRERVRGEVRRGEGHLGAGPLRRWWIESNRTKDRGWS